MKTIEKRVQSPGERVYWEFTSVGQQCVRVRADDGALWSYLDLQAAQPIPSHEATHSLSEQEALAAGRTACQSVGIEIPSSTPESKLVDHSERGLIARFWRFTWQRMSHGYPFMDDWRHVTVNVTSGRLIGYNEDIYSEEPETFDVMVDREKASRLAADFAQDNEMGGEIKGATLKIVNPNYRWTDRFTKIPPVQTRLAWVVELSMPSRISDEVAHIWIDASDGKLLGGDQCL